MTTPLNIRLPMPDPKVYSDPKMAQDQREFRRQIELAFQQAGRGSGGQGATDGLYAAEAFCYNAGNVLVAGDSDWLDIPSDFEITNAELVCDQAGTLSIDVYASSYGSWPTFTKISGTAPIAVSGSIQSRTTLTGWTTSFTGGHYLRFTITGTPASITKATVTLTLAVPAGATGTGSSPSGPAGGVLAGTYPNPTFAVDMATQAELDAVAATIPSNSAIRAQTEAELVAGSNITITPSGSGATRQLTISAATGGGSTTMTVWDPDKPPASANALDVELSGASTLSAWPAAWTTMPSGDFDSPTYPSTTPGQLIIRPTGSAWHGKYVAIPAGDFNIALHGSAFGIDADFTMLALGVSSTTNIGVGSDLWMEFGRRSSWGIRYNTYSPFTTVQTFRTDQVHRGLVAFIRRVGTTYTVGWSVDGKQLVSFGSISLGFTPVNFIVAAFGSQSAALATIRWVRYLSSGTATTYGGARVVECV